MKRKIAFIMALLFILALFSGCNGGTATTPTAAPATEQPAATTAPTAAPTAAPATQKPAETPAPTEAPPPEPADHLAKGKVSFDAEGWPAAKYEYELPLTDNDATFSMFTINYTPQYIPEGGMNELPIWGNMGKMTGVHIEYIMSSATTCSEQFAALLAADDLPDITAQGQSRFTGTLWEAIEDSWYANIANYREYIPNYLYELKKASDLNPNSYEKAFLDKDHACVMYGMRRMASNIGWCIREDIMEKLGLGKAEDVTTIDKLHDVFTAMKANREEDFYPMILYYCFELSGGRLLSGYNTALFTFSMGYYKRIVDGHVQYCGSTDDDRAALATLAQWYSEGLIDPNWGSYTGNGDLSSQIANSKIAYVHLTVDDCRARDASCTDPDCRYMPTPRLRLYEGQTLKWGLAPNLLGDGSFCVSAKCDDIPLCLSWCDWQYSDAGSDYISWGPEGDLFYYNEAGQKRLTDMILNSDAGTTWILQLYGANTMTEGGLVDTARNYAIDGGEELLAMNQIWDVSSYYDGEYDWHDGIRLSTEQSSEVNSLSGDMNSYYQENYSMFLTGARSMSEWDEFIDTLNTLGLKEILEIYDEAYQAYLNQA